MYCFKANPISRNEIREYVYEIKKELGLENELFFPIVKFVENVLPELIPGFTFEIKPVEEMGTLHGRTYPSKNIIQIREDIYIRAVRGEGRDRLTIAHEVGHLLMHDETELALCRLSPGSSLKPYEDPEWQANAFGGELLASSYLIDGMTAEEVKEKCGVSLVAAKNQLKSIK
ncbi:MAG: ImmA/IrrE family metallo-endopeptidase [Erysipelotrichaceae bacterium]|nr:ImmA/IrrE family metallo-endopeptidase [Erysipelotrichaceae bacterium]